MAPIAGSLTNIRASERRIGCPRTNTPCFGRASLALRYCFAAMKASSRIRKRPRFSCILNKLGWSRLRRRDIGFITTNLMRSSECSYHSSQLEPPRRANSGAVTALRGDVNGDGQHRTPGLAIHWRLQCFEKSVKLIKWFSAGGRPSRIEGENLCSPPRRRLAGRQGISP